MFDKELVLDSLQKIKAMLDLFRVLFLILLRPLTLARPKVFFAGKFCSFKNSSYICRQK